MSIPSFQEEPREVILRKAARSMVDESVVDQMQIAVPVQQVSTKITLEKPVRMVAVGNLHGGRVVVLAEQQVPAGSTVQCVVGLGEAIGIQVDQHTLDQRQVELPRGLK